MNSDDWRLHRGNQEALLEAIDQDDESRCKELFDAIPISIHIDEPKQSTSENSNLMKEMKSQSRPDNDIKRMIGGLSLDTIRIIRIKYEQERSKMDRKTKKMYPWFKGQLIRKKKMQFILWKIMKRFS